MNGKTRSYNYTVSDVRMLSEMPDSSQNNHRDIFFSTHTYRYIDNCILLSLRLPSSFSFLFFSTLRLSSFFYSSPSLLQLFFLLLLLLLPSPFSSNSSSSFSFSFFFSFSLLSFSLLLQLFFLLLFLSLPSPFSFNSSCSSFSSFSLLSFSLLLQLFFLLLLLSLPSPPFPTLLPPPFPSLLVNTMVSIDVLMRCLLLFVYMMLSVLNQNVQDMGHVTWVHVHVIGHGWDQYVMC